MALLEVYVDANVFVSSKRRSERFQHIPSRNFLKFMLNKKNLDNFKFFTSRFTLLEVASALKRRTNRKSSAHSMLYTLIKTWTPFLTFLEPKFEKSGPPKPFLDDYIDRLIETTLIYDTPAGDTIHASLVDEYDIEMLVTWNKKDFKGLEKKIKKLRVLNPAEFLLENKSKPKDKPVALERKEPVRKQASDEEKEADLLLKAAFSTDAADALIIARDLAHVQLNKEIKKRKLEKKTDAKKKIDLDIDVRVSELHKHGGIYELNLFYHVLNKSDIGISIRDAKYYFLDPINKEMPKGEMTAHRKQVFTLLKGPVHLRSNESGRIDDFIPSYPLSENLKMGFVLIHTHGVAKVIKNLKIGFK